MLEAKECRMYCVVMLIDLVGMSRLRIERKHCSYMAKSSLSAHDKHALARKVWTTRRPASSQKGLESSYLK